MSYEHLEARIAAWAVTHPDICAIIAVGSQARGDADIWSDLDLMLLTHDRERYLESDWLHTFGTVWLMYKDSTLPGDPEWFVIYEGGLKVDIVLLQVEEPSSNLEIVLQRYPYQGVFGRGVKVLFDQSGQARSLPPRPAALSAPPSLSDFDHVVNGFLVEALTTAKFIARGDFWRAQHWLAYDLRPHLLRLMMWQAHGRDTWYNGRFLESWADPHVVAALPETFAIYERESLRTALRTLLDLCQLVGEDVAARFHFSYPLEAHRHITHHIDSLLEADGPST